MSISKVLYRLLSFVLGAVFIVSAMTKLSPVYLFELALVDGYFSNWTMAPYMARIIISFEFGLGILLLLNLYFGKRLLKVVMLVLGIFTIHLVILYALQGNTGNCMCFGNVIKMKPVESIIKNIVLFGITFLLFKKHEGIKWNYSIVILIVSIIISLLVPFVLRPVFSKEKLEALGRNAENISLNLNVLNQNNSSNVELNSGKHVVAFLSTGCSHCKLAAYKLALIQKENPELPIHLIFADSLHFKEFTEEAKSADLPYSFLGGVEFFVRTAGGRTPTIYYVENDTARQSVNYMILSTSDITQWVNK